MLTGVATMLNGPFYMAADPRDQTYLVVNTLAQSVAVFAGAALNNAPPLRVLTSASLNFPCGVALDPQRDLLYVSNPGAGSISVFAQASLANGNVAPVHVITGLSQPFGLALDPHFDRLFVAQAGNHSIAVFDGASATDGAVAPNRTFTSPGLQQPQHITFDAEAQRLFVASRITGFSIFEGASSLDGSVAPNLAVARPARGVAVDLLRSQVFITATDNQIYTFELPVEIRDESPGNVVDCGRSSTHVNEDTLVPCDSEAIRFQVTCPLLFTAIPIPVVPIPPPPRGVPEAPLPFPPPAPPPPPRRGH
ncbi:MAG: beta-propeller fold lactonase family protein [Armatimonadetes bacterium]|nr:beta-propeller fold lactonase family protein [Armatimonadota bacterium]